MKEHVDPKWAKKLRAAFRNYLILILEIAK